MSNIFEIELPKLLISEIHVGGSDGIWVANRSPGPSETGVPADSTISFDLLQVGPDAPTAGEILVDGVVAFDWATGEQNGFDVSVTTHSSTAGGAIDRWHFVITPSAALDSLSVVNVTGSFTAGATDHPFAWLFSVEDLTKPTLSSVRALGPKTIEVTFDEKVDDAALATSSYVIHTIGEPAVDVVVTSVQAADGTGRIFLLETDTEMTGGAIYAVICSGIRDLFGNEIDPDHFSLEFSAIAHSMPGRNFRLWDLLPEMNRREDIHGELHTLLSVLQEPLDLLLQQIDKWPEILDPATAEERHLDLMLAELGNPFPFEMTALEKRRLIDVLVQIYREKGTEEGLKRAIRFFMGIEIEVETLDENLGYVILGDSLLGEDGPTRASMVCAATSPYTIPASTRLLVRSGHDNAVQTVAFGAAVSAPGPFQTPDTFSSIVVTRGATPTTVSIAPGVELEPEALVSLLLMVVSGVDAWVSPEGRVTIASKTAGQQVTVTDVEGTFGFTTVSPDLAGDYSAQAVVDALNLQLPDVEADIHGELEAGFSGPYSIADGSTLILKIDGGMTQTIVFAEEDFGDARYVSTDDLVAYFAASLNDVLVEKTIDDRFRISSLTEDGSVQVVGGTSLENFGIAEATISGKSVRISSSAIGADTAIEIPGHDPLGALSANAVLQFPEGMVEGAGHGFELWPGDRVAVYSFNVICPTVLTAEQHERLIYIANYMKPAHTHLHEVVPNRTPTVMDHLLLGVSKLGQNWLLH